MTKPKRFSKLSKTDQDEILASPEYKQYAERIQHEDWVFSKVVRGKLKGKWATY